MPDWLPIASVLASAVLTVGNIMADEAAKTAARSLAEQFRDKFLRSHKVEQHKEKLRAALEKTETAFQQSSYPPAQISAVLTRINALVTNAALQNQALETMLLLDEPDPALISNDLLRAFGFAAELRPALAAFLFTFRIHFAQIQAYAPLMDFAGKQQTRQILRGILKLEARAVDQRDQMLAYLRALAKDRDIHLEADEGRALQRYQEFVVRKHHQLSLFFVPPPQGKPAQVELQTVFVPLAISDPETRERLALVEHDSTRRREEKVGHEREARQTAEQLLTRHSALAIRGTPGSGKTTLMRHLALVFADGRAESELNWRGDPLLPIYVPLRNFGIFLKQRESGIIGPKFFREFIEDYFENQDLELPPEFFLRRLKEGRCLLLLDGLDEVEPARRAAVAQQVAAFIDHADYRRNFFILTSRPKGYDQVATLLEKRLTVCDVLPLSDSEMERLIRNLCAVVEESPSNVAERADELCTAVARHEKIRDLARTPLFLSVIVLARLYRQAALPQRRVDVYAQCMDLMLGLWEMRKSVETGVAESEALAREGGTGGVYPEDIEEAVGIKQKILTALAYWLHQDRLAFIPRDQVLEWLARYYLDEEDQVVGKPDAAKERARDFLRSAHERSGIFVESDPDTYKFSHHGFQEFLAASAIVGKPNAADLLLPILTDDWWREVVLLAAAHPKMGVDNGTFLLQRILEQAAPLASPDAWLSNLLVAGACLVDMGKDRVGGAMRRRIITALQTTMQSPTHAPKDRAAAGETLDALGWLPDDLDDWIEIPEGETTFGNKRIRVPAFYIAKYPVTCAQYEKFIADGGYEKEPYWQNQRGVDDKTGKEKPLGNEAWGWLQQAGGAKRRPWRWDDPRFHRAGYPVIGVTWYEASAYCAWLTEKLQGSEGAEVQRNIQPPISNLQSPTSNFQVGLPSELEWVRAAGGEENERYPWDKPVPHVIATLSQSKGKQSPNDSEIASARNARLAMTEAQQKEIVLARANVEESEIGGTTPVAMYPDGASEPFKVWDMGGNVWEWTSTMNKDGWQFSRGGSWYGDYTYSRVGARGHWARLAGDHFGGFRVFVR